MSGNGTDPSFEQVDDAIVIDLDDDTFNALKRLADAQGMDVNDFAGLLLKEAALKMDWGAAIQAKP